MIRVVSRKLLKIVLQNESFESKWLTDLKENVKERYDLTEAEVGNFVFAGRLVNNAYNTNHDKINVLYKDGSVKDISEAADTLNIKVLSEPVRKYFVCYPKMV